MMKHEETLHSNIYADEWDLNSQLELVVSCHILTTANNAAWIAETNFESEKHNSKYYITAFK